jgi:hypothetical protein
VLDQLKCGLAKYPLDAGQEIGNDGVQEAEDLDRLRQNPWRRGGRQYRTALAGSPWPWEAPLQGLGIWQQLGWPTRELAAV